MFLFHQSFPLTQRPNSYVQELDARLLHMESLFSQITPVLEQLGPSLNLPGVLEPQQAVKAFQLPLSSKQCHPRLLRTHTATSLPQNL
jgi:hypothetical protein